VGNFANAGSALSAGLQGGAATMEAGQLATAGMGGVSPTAATLPTASTAPAATTPLQDALVKDGLVRGAPQMSVAGVPVPAATPGLAEGMIGAAKISAGTQLVGGLINGYGQQKAAEDQRNYEQQQAEAARARYNENVGTNWWPSSSGGSGGSTGQVAPRYAAPADPRIPVSPYAVDSTSRAVDPYAADPRGLIASNLNPAYMRYYNA
jgi:hypothetical protein